MRVSTSMIFDAGVGAIQRQTASLLHTQQQVATGRRILTPADDPVAAARALEVSHARDINTQYRTNQDNAKTRLGLVDSQLAAVTSLIQDVQEQAVRAVNGTLTPRDLASIAMEARARFDHLLGIANAADGSGLYLFSGYQGATRPFSGSVASAVAYAGDDGERLLQVSASRQLATSASGNDIFMRIRDGNGEFATGFAAGNAGTGLVDGGNVLTAYNGHTYTLTFSSGASGLQYSVADFDPVSGATVSSGPFAYQAGAAIQLGGGSVSLTISGAPSAGDTFSVQPSTSRSLFDTIASFVQTLEGAAMDAAGRTRLVNEIGQVQSNLAQALDNVLRVRAAVGTRLSEIDALASLGEDLHLQYEATLSGLQDVDYAAAISRLTQERNNLEAAQQSFLKVSELSLFNYL